MSFCLRFSQLRRAWALKWDTTKQITNDICVCSLQLDRRHDLLSRNLLLTAAATLTNQNETWSVYQVCYTRVKIHVHNVLYSMTSLIPHRVITKLKHISRCPQTGLEKWDFPQAMYSIASLYTPIPPFPLSLYIILNTTRFYPKYNLLHGYPEGRRD